MILRTNESKALTEQLLNTSRGRNYVTATIPTTLLRRLNQLNQMYGPEYDAKILDPVEVTV